MINPMFNSDFVLNAAKELKNIESEDDAFGVLCASAWSFLTMSNFSQQELDTSPYLVALSAAFTAISEAGMLPESFDDWRHAIIEAVESHPNLSLAIAARDIDNLPKDI